MQLDDTLIALADDTRRRILRRLASGEARVTEVAEPFAISLNSVSKHIRLLERAGLVRRRVAGRDHFLALEPKPFDELTQWMQETRAFWSSRLDHLEAALRAEDAIEKAKENTPIPEEKEKQVNHPVTTLPVTVVEPGTVKVERLLPGPIERAWAYIVESDKRAKWLAGGEFDLRVGGKVRLEFDNSRLPNEKNMPAKYKDLGKGQFEGVITRLEPLRLLAHTWKWDSGDTEVSYELAPRGKQVLLTIVHRRLTKELVGKVLGGWDVHSGILEDILNGVEPRPFWATHEKVAPEYASLAQ